MKTFRLENTISQIVQNHRPCYFISPHLDDAALSAGALISYLAERTFVSILTVFTKGGTSPYTLSEKAFLKQTGYPDFTALYQDRRAEDRKVWEQRSLPFVHLDFMEALCRKKPHHTSPGLLGKYWPELNAVYPTWKFHIARGKVAKEDANLSEQIKTRLENHISKDQQPLVFCPVGIGRHVDHILIRDLCHRHFDKVVFWSDYPYALKSSPDSKFVSTHTGKEFIFSDHMAEKKALVSGYSSQVEPLFGSAVPAFIPEKYYESKK